MRISAKQAGGHATIFRAGSAYDRNAGVFTPLPAPLMKMHRGLKEAFDPARIFNRARLYPVLGAPTNRHIQAMQTNLAEFIRGTADGDEADSILRKCVHCGFCTATCPTYQLLDDELDGPRERIYLMKQMLEGAPVTRSTQTHLDRCLTCRNCESTCPSGMQYGRLVEIGRKVVEDKVERPMTQRLQCRLLASLLPNSTLFTPAIKLGQQVRGFLPRKLRAKIPVPEKPLAPATGKHARKMLMLAGCVQPAMMPNVNTATARVFDVLGIEIVTAPDAGCCDAIRLHLGYNDDALDDVRNNIDA